MIGMETVSSLVAKAETVRYLIERKRWGLWVREPEIARAKTVIQTRRRTTIDLDRARKVAMLGMVAMAVTKTEIETLIEIETVTREETVTESGIVETAELKMQADETTATATTMRTLACLLYTSDAADE